MTIDEFFDGYPRSREMFDLLSDALGDIEGFSFVPAASQVALVDGAPFAWVWIPDRYLSGGHAPLVLTIPSRARIESDRFKEAPEVRPGRYVHHLELWDDADVDAQVVAWLQDAREASRS